jgi:hypothetical protein
MGVLASEKALEDTEPPLVAMARGMPLPEVCPPTPPTLLIVKRVEPLAFPPLIMILGRPAFWKSARLRCLEI